MLKIWGRTNSSNVQKLIWLCEEAGIAYERTDAGGVFGVTKTPEYLAMNPNALVPTIDDDGFVLWESNSILRYLANKHQLQAWYPQDFQARAQVEKWMDWGSIAFAGALIPAYWQIYRTAPEKRDIGFTYAQAEKTLAMSNILNQHLAQQSALGMPFIQGAAPSLADVVNGIMVYRWLNMPWEGVAGFKRPEQGALQAWYQALCERPAFAKHVMLPLS